MIRFVPIPTPDFGAEHPLAFIEGSRRHWEPFLPKICRRAKEDIEIIEGKIMAGTLQLALAWDDEKKKALGVLGLQYRREGDDLVCEVVHLSGHGLKDWGHLLPQVHAYAKEHVHCTKMKTYCRRGFERFLKGKDYTITHVIMEHRL
jgi:hypothetical protein